MAVAVANKDIDQAKVSMNKIIRNNAKIKTGDLCTIKVMTEVPNHSKIHILPFADTIEGI